MTRSLRTFFNAAFLSLHGFQGIPLCSILAEVSPGSGTTVSGKSKGPFLESPGNLPGPISIFLNNVFYRLHSDYRHGTWANVFILL